MRASLLAVVIVVVLPTSSALAQDAAPAPVIVVTHAPPPPIVVPVAPPPPIVVPVAQAPALALGAPADSPRPRRSIAARVATAAGGAALVGGGWVVTWIGTMGWYFDSTECHGASVSFFGPDPDGPYHCVHHGPNDDALGASFIPIAGPWIMLSTPGIDPAFPATMGVIQAAGVLTLVIGVPLAWSGSAGESVALDVRSEPGGARLVLEGRF